MKQALPPRSMVRARTLIRAELGTNLRDSLLYGMGAAFSVLIAGLLIAAV